MVAPTVNFYTSSRFRAAALVVVALATALPPVSAGNAQSGAPLALKLDYDLVPRLDSPGVGTRSLLDGAGAAELQSRVLKVRDQARALAQSNEDKARLLAERQRVLAGIQGIVRAQARMIEVLEAGIAGQAEKATALAAPPPRPAGAADQGPAAPLRIGPVEIPPWLEPWLLEGVLGMVIVVLLGVILRLRASAAGKEAKLAALSSGLVAPGDRAVTTPAAAPRRAEPPAGAARPSARTAPPPAADTRPPPMAQGGQRDLDADDPKSISSDKGTSDRYTEPIADGEADDMDFLFDIFGDDEELKKTFADDSKRAD